jgi:hypothetical protein
VYAIFREHGSIARPGNSQLFGLLCQVRTDLQPRLLRILSGGFGRDRQEAADEQSLGFSGCYFAATGRSEDRRAFVRGVFDKLPKPYFEFTKDPEGENVTKSEDFFFCDKLTAAGMRLAVDPRVRPGHLDAVASDYSYWKGVRHRVTVVDGPPPRGHHTIESRSGATETILLDDPADGGERG